MRLTRSVMACLLLASTAQATPFEEIQNAYAPYLDTANPLSFDLKIKSLATDEYKFWRGSKDLFYAWTRQNCSDWLADADAFLPNHGDLHLGNIGTYASEEGFGKLAFGMVDFDDSARLPFEFELLQGLITLDLVIKQNHLTLTSAQRDELDATLFDAYRTAVNSQRNATDLLHEDVDVIQMLTRPAKRAYAEELSKFAPDGTFVRAIKKKKAVSEILQSCTETELDAFAAGIADAIEADEDLASQLRFGDRKSVRQSLISGVRRTRMGSSGSQGQRKWLLLLRNPFKAYEGDAILYLKETIPSSAERAGVIPRDSRDPAERLRDHMNKLTSPRPFLNAAVRVGGQSYWLTFKEPWSSEIEFDGIESFAHLQRAARVWGTVAGATHRDDGRFEMILPRLTPVLKRLIRDRATAYALKQAADYANFAGDERVKACIERADRAIDATR